MGWFDLRKMCGLNLKFLEERKSKSSLLRLPSKHGITRDKTFNEIHSIDWIVRMKVASLHGACLTIVNDENVNEETAEKYSLVSRGFWLILDSPYQSVTVVSVSSSIVLSPEVPCEGLHNNEWRHIAREIKIKFFPSCQNHSFSDTAPGEKSEQPLADRTALGLKTFFL